MNRRQLLIASAAAAAAAGTNGAFAAMAAPACALYPVDSTAGKRNGIDELRLVRRFPAEIPGAVDAFDVDLSLLDERGGLHTILAWQMERGRPAPSRQAGFRMRFSTAQLDLRVRLRGPDKLARHFNARIAPGAESLLLSARASTGAPPALAELRMDAARQSLWLADRSPRDFEAVLLRAS